MATAALSAEQRIQHVQATAKSQVGDSADLARDEQIATASRWGSMGAGLAVASKGGWVGVAAYGAAIGGGYAGAWLAEATGADELAAKGMETFLGMQRIGGGGPHPARVTDQVAHSHAFGGFLASIIVGAIAAVAVGALIVATGGTAAVVLIGAAAAGGFTAGFLGSAIGKAASGMGTRTGPIAEGSPDVFIEGKAAARMTDKVACSKESTPQPIIEGSETIFVNGLPLARIGHKVLCNAVIDQGAITVDMDETTQACAQPAPDIPLWARVAADWLGFLPVGKAAAIMGNRSRSAAARGRSQCNVTCAKDPVDVATGRFVDFRCDIRIPGALPIEWRRHYATSREPAPGFHGSSWLDSWSVRLSREARGGRTIHFHDDEGVVYTFHTPDEVLEAEHLRNPALVLRGTHEAPELWDRDRNLRSHFAWTGDQARLVGFSDPNGNRCDFVYDAQSAQLVELRHSDGWRLQLVWERLDADHGAHARGHLRSVWLDDPGRPMVELARFEHDTHGRLTSSDSVESGRLRYRYDHQHRIVGWGDDAQTQVRIHYDVHGRVEQVTAPGLLHSGRFDYDLEARTTRVWSLTGSGPSDRDPCTHYVYNEDGLVVLERDALGHESRTTWDRHHRVLARTDALGRTTTFDHDDAGRLVGVTDPQGRTVTTSFDAEGRSLGSIDPYGRRTTITRDDRGRVVEVMHTDGTLSTWDYTARGAVLREHHPGGGVTQYHHDEAHRPCGLTAPDGGHTAWRQDRLGRIEWWTDAAHATTTCDYEPGGHPSHPAAQAPRAHTHWLPSRIVMADGSATVQAFDSEGLMRERTDTDGHTQHWRWGAFDLLQEHVDAAGHHTRYRYTDHGAGPTLAELTTASGRSWRWRHDAAGRLVEQIDTAGRRTLWQHDAVGRPITKTLPDGSRWHYRWDLGDRLESVDAPDVRHVYGYDDRDRLTLAQVWRVEGHPSQAWRCDSQLAFEYDEHDRLVTEIHRLGLDAEPRRLALRYDGQGRRIARETPLGESRYTYDALDLLQELRTTHGLVHLARDAMGRETDRSSVPPGSPGGAAAAPAGQPHFHHRQAHDKLGRLVQQSVRAPGAHQPDTVLRHYHWQHQRLVGVDDARRGQLRWQLDAREQIVQASHQPAAQPLHSTLLRQPHHDEEAIRRHEPVAEERYAYDAMGNLSAIGTAGATTALSLDADVVTRRGDDRYTWDARGRLASRTLTRRGFRPQTWHYAWDGFDRLVGLTTPAGRRWRYVYDALGRRVAKELLSPTPTGTAPTPARRRLRRAEYLWDGATVAVQWKLYADGTPSAQPAAASSSSIRPSSAIAQEWHYEPGSFTPLAVLQARADETRLFHVVSDPNGAPRELIGNDGDLVWAAQLDTWGHLLRAEVQDADRAHTTRFAAGYTAAANDPLIEVDLRFANQWADEESGLHYNLNRYYDPDLAGYLSQDPLGVAGGLRTHGYVHNPLTWIDPMGLAGCPYTFSRGSLRHILRRHSPHVGPPKQQPYASLKPAKQKGTLYPKEWSNRDIATSVQEVASNPMNQVLSSRPDFHGKVFEGTVTRNGVTQKLRVITDHYDPTIGGTGPGVITSGYPIK